MTKAISISCDECIMQHSDHCQDCLVSFICGQSPSSVNVPVGETVAVLRLIDGGLLPKSRFLPKAV